MIEEDSYFGDLVLMTKETWEFFRDIGRFIIWVATLGNIK